MGSHSALNVGNVGVYFIDVRSCVSLPLVSFCLLLPLFFFDYTLTTSYKFPPKTH